MKDRIDPLSIRPGDIVLVEGKFARYAGRVAVKDEECSGKQPNDAAPTPSAGTAVEIAGSTSTAPQMATTSTVPDSDTTEWRYVIDMMSLSLIQRGEGEFLDLAEVGAPVA